MASIKFYRGKSEGPMKTVQRENWVQSLEAEGYVFMAVTFFLIIHKLMLREISTRDPC
jgi:hypothetical protein